MLIPRVVFFLRLHIYCKMHEKKTCLFSKKKGRKKKRYLKMRFLCLAFYNPRPLGRGTRTIEWVTEPLKIFSTPLPSALKLQKNSDIFMDAFLSRSMSSCYFFRKLNETCTKGLSVCQKKKDQIDISGSDSYIAVDSLVRHARRYTV